MIFRSLFAAAFLALWAVPASAQEIGHVVYDGPTTFGPDGLTLIDNRIKTAAQNLKKDYPQGISRYAAFDMAFPRDEDEYYRLGKNGVILISAVTQDAAELPLARVTIRNGDTLTELKLLASGNRETADDVQAMFGSHRQDAIYLVPLDQVKRGATLECDFAIARQGFVLARLRDPEPYFIRADSGRKSGPQPSARLLQALISREYPGVLSTQ
jgi:hypothetical protein